jgi:hypothetical protein
VYKVTYFGISALLSEFGGFNASVMLIVLSFMSPYVSIKMKKDTAKQAKQPIAEMPEKLEDRVSFSGINYLFD